MTRSSKPKVPKDLVDRKQEEKDTSHRERTPKSVEKTEAKRGGGKRTQDAKGSKEKNLDDSLSSPKAKTSRLTDKTVKENIPQKKVPADKTNKEQNNLDTSIRPTKSPNRSSQVKNPKASEHDKVSDKQNLTSSGTKSPKNLSKDKNSKNPSEIEKFVFGKTGTSTLSDEEELDYVDDVGLYVEAESDTSPGSSKEIADSETERKSRGKQRLTLDEYKRDRKYRKKNRSRSKSRSKDKPRRKLYYDSSSSSDDDEEYMEKMLKLMKRMKKEEKKKKRKSRRRSRSKTRSRSRSRSKQSRRRASSTSSEDDTRHKSSRQGRKNEEVYKSPSDTMIYAPAIACLGLNSKLKNKYSNRKEDERGGNTPTADVSGVANLSKTDGNSESETIAKTNQEVLINDFLTNMRLGEKTTEKQSTRVRSEVRVPKEQRSKLELAREDADQMVIQAEKYKAQLLPEGMIDKLNKLFQSSNDDEFFYTNCHIDETIRDKIKKGGFVELEKLLVRRKGMKPRNEHKVDIVSKDGVTSITSTEDKETKITSVHKWDQAFRVYATIYTKENPHRGSEIWQYIDTIHRAAKTFYWDSVAEYDYCFRQLMAEYPQRSWSQIYTQMWNLTLCEGGQKTQANNGGSNSTKRDGKGVACWKFNKGRCNYGPRCKFEHRCSYCLSYNHGSQNCPRKESSRSRGERHQDRDRKKHKRNSGSNSGDREHNNHD